MVRVDHERISAKVPDMAACTGTSLSGVIFRRSILQFIDPGIVDVDADALTVPNDVPVGKTAPKVPRSVSADSPRGVL